MNYETESVPCIHDGCQGRVKMPPHLVFQVTINGKTGYECGACSVKTAKECFGPDKPTPPIILT